MQAKRELESWREHYFDTLRLFLFVQEIREKLEEHRKKLALQHQQQHEERRSAISGFTVHRQSHAAQHGYCNGLFANVILILCLCAFVGVVKFLVESIA